MLDTLLFVLEGLQKVRKCAIEELKYTVTEKVMKRKLAVGFVDFLDRKTSLTEDDREKCTYIAALFIGELMHLGVLGVFFWRIGCGSEFLISLGVVSLTRSFAGGLHSKSDDGCFLHTFAFFMMAVCVAKYIHIRILAIPVCALLLCVFLKYAPISSRQRGRFGTKMRKKLDNAIERGEKYDLWIRHSE